MPYSSIQRHAVTTGVPRPLPATVQGQAAAPVAHDADLPYRSWEYRAVARFEYPNDDRAPDGAQVYNASPVWLFPDSVAATADNPHGLGYVNAGRDFDKALALAHARATQRDARGHLDKGSQAIMQARSGAYYIAELYGWGDEVPVRPGEPGGGAGPYMLEDVADAGGVVHRYTPSLKAIVGTSTWVDFRRNDRADRQVP